MTGSVERGVDNPDGSDVPPTTSSARPRALVADDEEGTLALLSEMLTHGGFDVVPAYDGLEALARAREAPPDIALLDVMMPGLDGREVCRRMSADPALTHVPVILHSSADERDVDWRRCGADAFLQKPFRVSRLPDFVRQHLSARVGTAPRARRLTDDEVRALATEIRAAVRAPRSAERPDHVLAPHRELSPEDEARVEAALLELLMSARGHDAEVGGRGAARRGDAGDRGRDATGPVNERRDDDPT